MTSWNSLPLEITYNVFGWIAFFSWSLSFYPQVILNFRRKWYSVLTYFCNDFYFFLSLAKACFNFSSFCFDISIWLLFVYLFIDFSFGSVVGLNFDFLVLNLTKHSSYLIYNASLFFSTVIQRQYHEKYGYGEMIPVAANDVAFSTHAVLLTAITLYQVLIYDCGNQKVSKTCIATTSIVWVSAAVCVFIAWPNNSWLWLISVFNGIQVIMTVLKYIPQALMNFMRKSTEGWSIGNILLDLFGGLMNYAQMAMQSIDQGSWINFYGNIGKTLLSLLTVFFDLLFICQHYLLYPSKKEKIYFEVDSESTALLAKSSDGSQSEKV